MIRMDTYRPWAVARAPLGFPDSKNKGEGVGGVNGVGYGKMTIVGYGSVIIMMKVAGYGSVMIMDDDSCGIRIGYDHDDLNFET